MKGWIVKPEILKKKMQFENYRYFPLFILPADWLNWNWVLCKFFFCVWLRSTSPQIYVQSETTQRTIFKYFLWNNHTGRKWGCGGNIPISHFPLAHGALFVIDIHQNMLISLFETPFDHLHFHPTSGMILWH